MSLNVSKALSIRQPWASLIAEGYKDIENRDWPTKFRGQFFIHSSKTKTYLKDDLEYIQTRFGIYTDRNPDDFYLGGIIGIGEITDCVKDSNSKWFTGDYGFVIQNPIKLPFHPYKGQLGFFNMPLEIIP